MRANAHRVVTETRFSGYPVRRGKVRDVYDLGDEILLVATDRISAYDVVLPTPIPGKGVMLTQISRFWFEFFGGSTAHHLLEVIEDQAPSGLEKHLDQLRGRTMRCRKAQVVPIECVVRGYLAGSGWTDYQRTGAVCGVKLPPGLRQSEKLPEPIFTPATKADEGHDENISFEEACELVDKDCMTLLRERSIDLYKKAADHARRRGIIIADTKFEWGLCGSGDCGTDSLVCRQTDWKVSPTYQRDYLLIDEVLTPDSSRFWPAEAYEPGRDQESFDKQYVRNYLTSLVEAGKWDKTPPGPELPDEIVANTAAKYREAVRRLMQMHP